MFHKAKVVYVVQDCQLGLQRRIKLRICGMCWTKETDPGSPHLFLDAATTLIRDGADVFSLMFSKFSSK